MTRAIPALALALLLTGSTAGAATNSTMLPSGALGTNASVSRSSDRDDLLSESTSIVVAGQYTTTVDAESVITEAPINATVQQARDAISSTILTARATLENGKGIADSSDFSALSDLISKSEAICSDNSAKVDDINQMNQDLANATATVQNDIIGYNNTVAVVKAMQSGSSFISDSLPEGTTAATAEEAAGQGTSNGDVGNRYAVGQCTWWAYERRKQLGISTPSYLGNGGEWYKNAASYGLTADHTPRPGAAISFAPGQVSRSVYGHVGVVEWYSAATDTIVISEMNVRGKGIVSYRTFTNASQYWYVH